MPTAEQNTIPITAHSIGTEFSKPKAMLRILPVRLPSCTLLATSGGSMMTFRYPLALAAAMLVASTATAHHSVLHYDGKTEVKISGVVTKARFGFPHSVYRIDVTTDEGFVEEWTLTTEDPRDAERLGFADEIKAIKVGDPITVVGWPHRFNEREIRGHQLHYPDGHVVMMRRGNYIWPKDILRLDKLVMNPHNIEGQIEDIDASLPDAEQLVLWIDEGDHIARAAYEVTQDRPRLIGISDGGDAKFSGVDELLDCHTKRPDFIMKLSLVDMSSEQQARIKEGAEYISEYNRVLSRWWEQEKSTCS